MDKAKQLAYFYLKFRARTEKEMRDFLIRKQERFKYSEDDINATINHLKDLNYLNDLEYIENYVRNKTALKPQGVTRLKFDLKRKGVPDSVLSTFFSSDVVDEDAGANEALSKRWRKFEGLTPHERFEKAARFLASRGFSYTIIKKTIADYENNEVKYT
jgi:regulatory protein